MILKNFESIDNHSNSCVSINLGIAKIDHQWSPLPTAFKVSNYFLDIIAEKLISTIISDDNKLSPPFELSQKENVPSIQTSSIPRFSYIREINRNLGAIKSTSSARNESSSALLPACFCFLQEATRGIRPERLLWHSRNWRDDDSHRACRRWSSSEVGRKEPEVRRRPRLLALVCDTRATGGKVRHQGQYSAAHSGRATRLIAATPQELIVDAAIIHRGFARRNISFRAGRGFFAILPRMKTTGNRGRIRRLFLFLEDISRLNVFHSI